MTGQESERNLIIQVDILFLDEVGFKFWIVDCPKTFELISADLYHFYVFLQPQSKFLVFHVEKIRRLNSALSDLVSY